MSEWEENNVRTLQCPTCGHITRSQSIGRVYCGPHQLGETGEYMPAVPMREVHKFTPEVRQWLVRTANAKPHTRSMKTMGIVIRTWRGAPIAAGFFIWTRLWRKMTNLIRVELTHVEDAIKSHYNVKLNR